MRKSAGVLCLVIAVFATIVTDIDLPAPALVVAAAWQVVPQPPAIAVRREDAPDPEQTSPLLSFTLSRPPPRPAVAA